MADKYKIYHLCDVCWGRGVIDKMVSPPNEPPVTVEIECPQCVGQKLIYRGHSIPDPGDVFFSHRIFEATVPAEYRDLSDANKAAYGLILSCGLVDLSAGSNARTLLSGMFGAGTTTRANILALLEE